MKFNEIQNGNVNSKSVYNRDCKPVSTYECCGGGGLSIANKGGIGDNHCSSGGSLCEDGSLLIIPSTQ